MKLIIFPVIHPGLRLNWIRKHWGADFLEDAVKKIKETVRTMPPFSLFICSLTTMYYQISDG